jgi:hypothetical protein
MPTPTPPVPTNGEGRKEELARAARKLGDHLRRREDDAKKSQATKDQALIADAEAKVAQVRHELDELTHQAAVERERATQDVAAASRAREACARQLAEAREAAELAEQTARTQSEEGLRDKQLATAAQGNLSNCEERERAMRAAKEKAEARALQLESDVASANEARDECRLRLNSAVQEADTAGRNFQEALRSALAGASENAAALEDAAETAQTELRACEERVQSASADLAAAQETLRRVREENGEAKRRARVAEEAARAAAVEMAQMKEENQEAREEVLFLNDQLARTNAELAGATAIIDQKEHEMRGMEERFESLRSDLDEKSRVYELEQEAYDRRFVNLTAEKAAALMAASNMCEARVTQAYTKATEAEVDRDAAQQRAERTMREKAALETRIYELTAELTNKANAELVIAQTKRERDVAVANANAASARATACEAAESDINELKQELKEASVVLLWANQLDASLVDSMFGSTGTRLERYKHAANAMREKYETALDSVRADLKAKYRVVRGTEYPESHESAIRAMQPKQIAHLARKLHSEVSPAEPPSATTFLRMTLQQVQSRVEVIRPAQGASWTQGTRCNIVFCQYDVPVSCENASGALTMQFDDESVLDCAREWGSDITKKTHIVAFTSGRLEFDGELRPVIEIPNGAEGMGLLYALGFSHCIRGLRGLDVGLLRSQLLDHIRDRLVNIRSSDCEIDRNRARGTTNTKEEEVMWQEKTKSDPTFVTRYQNGHFRNDPSLAKYDFVCRKRAAGLGELEIDAFARIGHRPVCVWSSFEDGSVRMVYKSFATTAPSASGGLGASLSLSQSLNASAPILNFGSAIHLRRHASSEGRGHYTLLALVHPVH